MRKLELFDCFQCAAGGCSFTCCEGWEIEVDAETYEAWRRGKTHGGSMGNQISVVRRGRDDEPLYYIRLDSNRRCPYLDEDGLCSVVKEHGEGMLAELCRSFPRITNEYAGAQELTLTCACPTTVDLLWELTQRGGILHMLPVACAEAAADIQPEPETALLRNALMYRFERTLERGGGAAEALYEAFVWLSGLVREEHARAGLPEERAGLPAQTGSLALCNDIFLDVTDNYRNEPSFRFYLNDMCVLAAERAVLDCGEQWRAFCTEYAAFEPLLRNILRAKLFEHGACDEPSELLRILEILALEFAMQRYACFLQWLLLEEGGRLSYETLRDETVVFSRIIGSNIWGVNYLIKIKYDDRLFSEAYAAALLAVSEG